MYTVHTPIRSDTHIYKQREREREKERAAHIHIFIHTHRKKERDRDEYNDIRTDTSHTLSQTQTYRFPVKYPPFAMRASRRG
jgi:hypothetical protein